MKVSSQSEDSSIKLIQITDTHLFAAEDGSLLSVNTADSFAAVVAAIGEEQVEFDAILATGIFRKTTHPSLINALCAVFSR